MRQMLLPILRRRLPYVFLKKSIEYRFAVKADIQINMRDGLRFLFWVREHGFRFFDTVAVNKFLEVAIEVAVEYQR